MHFGMCPIKNTNLSCVYIFKKKKKSFLLEWTEVEVGKKEQTAKRRFVVDEKVAEKQHIVNLMF